MTEESQAPQEIQQQETPSESLDTSVSNSLMDSGSQPEGDAQGGEKSSESTWFYADGVPGVGDPPEWWNKEKYPFVSDQAKAHPELRKVLGAFTGAPDNYEVKLNESLGEIELDTENVLYKTFSGVAKDINMSQEGFDKLVNQYIEVQQLEENRQLTANSEFKKQEMEKLGEGGQELIKKLDQWGKNNLPEDLYSSYKEMASSADNIKIFEILRSKSGFTNIPDTQNQAGSEISRLQLREMKLDRRYGRDPEYTAHIEKLYEEKFA